MDERLSLLRDGAAQTGMRVAKGSHPDAREQVEVFPSLGIEEARAASGSRTTSYPARRAVPRVGLTVVVSIPIVVDLPAPLGPSSPNTSPGSTRKSTPWTASTPLG